MAVSCAGMRIAVLARRLVGCSGNPVPDHRLDRIRRVAFEQGSGRGPDGGGGDVLIEVLLAGVN